ncbi:MAG: Swt1 family HEPN domain-containing protein [Chloroflexota bacterium]
MAITNYERVGKAMDLLREGLAPFVGRELEAHFGKYWITEATAGWRQELVWPSHQDEPRLDIAALIRLMQDHWQTVFRNTLGQAERSLVFELRDARNKWAHQQAFSGDDTDRALDSAARLLTAISAPQADEINKMKMELRRLIFDEQMRVERRRGAGTAIETQATGALTPWREVATPHRDVASGRYQQAEFAADLWQVHLGEGVDEYRDPAEFFRRTYLTASLRGLLTDAVRRLAGSGGDPVVQLQTNFGGGKTHSMLALYHLFSGAQPGELLGADDVLKAAEVKALPKVNRVVLVGNKISPGNPVVKADGTKVCTLWGELAWQLGESAGGIAKAHQAFERVRADDERATSPGDTLRELMNQYGPCLILVDEWVAYARQLHDGRDLPAGTFETHFTFAQALTESAKLARQCLLVISLPASDTTGSPHTLANDEEVGGVRGQQALERLRNAVGRVESSWRPASAEEGFEIVRRRLFEPLTDRRHFVARDSVARAFSDFYKSQRQELPAECADGEYEQRLKSAYPIHPEVFDRLYTDWGALVKFQRTRGVLRLMAAVIHSLWEKGDRNPLIMPGNLPIDDTRVQFELTRYLSDTWVPVIEKDVDGTNALPLRLDGEIPNLGKLSACRRVARTIYLGSAPETAAANQGLEDRRVKLGCAMPGESPAVFGDALRRLSMAATFLYQDGTRYWYSTRATVTKIAEERAEELRRNPDPVLQELEKRVRANLRQASDFSRVHPLPRSGQDVPDDLDARLVVLSSEYPYSRVPGSAAETAAKAIFESRGNAPRLHRNALVFLAADQARLQDLDEALRRYLAWESILAEKGEDGLNLSPHQVRQAETQKASADGAVTARLPETYQWLLVPIQTSPQASIEWQAIRLTGADALAVRASKKLRSDELLVTALAGSRLRMELDRVPLWRGDHVAVQQLLEDFGRYLYLPRVKSSAVVLGAIRDGLGLLTWRTDTFGYADAWDESAGRYRGLRGGQLVSLSEENVTGLLVRPEAVRRQEEAETSVPKVPQTGSGGGSGEHSTPDGAIGAGGGSGGGTVVTHTTGPKTPAAPTRYHGTVTLDPSRPGRDASKIAEELIAHLSGLVGANVRVTLEIEAELPAGFPEHVVRTVTENGRTLKFSSQGFEER